MGIQQALISYPAPATGTTYATWNPSDKSADITLSGGDLIATNATGGWDSVRSTISKSSGKWYWECKLTGTAGGNIIVGIGKSGATLNDYCGSDANGWSWYASQYKINTNSFVAYGTGNFVTNDVIGVALDLDNGTVAFYKNNVSPGTAYTGLTGPMFAMISALSSNITANFGATTLTYSPPAGFNAGLYT